MRTKQQLARHTSLRCDSKGLCRLKIQLRDVSMGIDSCGWLPSWRKQRNARCCMCFANCYAASLALCWSPTIIEKFSKCFFFVLRTVFFHSLVLSFIHPSIHPSTQSIIHSIIHSFIHPSIHPFIHSFIHWFIDSLIHSFIHSFIHFSPFLITCTFIVAAVSDKSRPCFLAFLGCTIEITVNLLVKQFAAFNDLFHVVVTIQARCCNRKM